MDFKELLMGMTFVRSFSFREPIRLLEGCGLLITLRE
jgi:hypothetical protein